MTVQLDPQWYTIANDVGNNCTYPDFGISSSTGQREAKGGPIDKALKKTPSQGLNAPFRFDILAQLANILAHITLHELLDALADSESFLTQVPAISTDDNGVPCPLMSSSTTTDAFIFTSEDMLLKDNKHDRPLYYTGYIGSTCIKRIQVDSRSALNIIPKRLLYFLSISLNKLSTTTTTIYGFNVKSSHPLGKIRLWCQIGDLKSEVTCYIIDADTSIFCSNVTWFMSTGLFHPLCTNALSMWTIMLWSK